MARSSNPFSWSLLMRRESSTSEGRARFLPSRRSAYAVAMLATTGCVAVTGPETPPQAAASVAGWVTPGLAAQLDAGGRFIFGDITDGSGRATITAVRARAVARAFVNTFLRRPLTFLLPGSEDPREVFTRIHGRPVRWLELEPITSAVYPMLSPVFLVDVAVSTPDLSSVGSRYHVLFGARGAIVLDVMVSAYATDVTLSPDGMSISSLGSTNAIRVDALAAARVRELAIIPEIAVQSVGQRGRLVAALPELIMPWGRLTTLCSRWRLKLDAPIAVEFDDGHAGEETDVLYVGYLADSSGFMTLRWYVATDSQPTSGSIYVRAGDGSAREAVVSLSPTLPTRFREVRLPAIPQRRGVGRR